MSVGGEAASEVHEDGKSRSGHAAKGDGMVIGIVSSVMKVAINSGSIPIPGSPRGMDGAACFAGRRGLASGRRFGLSSGTVMTMNRMRELDT